MKNSPARALSLGLLALALAAAAPMGAQAAKRSPASLEARVRALEDEHAIIHLFADYEAAEDTNDWAGYANTFARNGELIFQSNDWKGPPTILEHMTAALNRPGSALATNALRHSFADVDIAVDGDRATARSRWVVMSRQADATRPLLGASGHVVDTLIREDGRWKFLKRIIFTDIPFDDPIANLAKAGRPVAK